MNFTKSTTFLRLSGIGSLNEEQKIDKFDDLMDQIEVNISVNDSPINKKKHIRSIKESNFTNSVIPSQLSLINLTVEDKTTKSEAQTITNKLPSEETKSLSPKRGIKIYSSDSPFLAKLFNNNLLNLVKAQREKKISLAKLKKIVPILETKESQKRDDNCPASKQTVNSVSFRNLAKT